MLKSVIFTDEGKRMYCTLFVYLNIAAFCILAFIGIFALFDDEIVPSLDCPSGCTPSDCVIYLPGSGKKTTGPCECAFVGSGVTQYLCSDFLPETNASFWKRKPYITGLITFYKNYFMFFILPLSLVYYWWSIGAANRELERQRLLTARASDVTELMDETGRTRKRIHNIETVNRINDEYNDYDLYDEETFDLLPSVLEPNVSFLESGLPGPLTVEEAATEEQNKREYLRLKAEHNQRSTTGLRFVFLLFLYLWIVLMWTIFALAFDADSDGYVPSSVCAANCVLKDCRMSASGNKEDFIGVCTCFATNSMGTSAQYCDRLMADPSATYLQRSKNLNVLVHFLVLSLLFLGIPYVIAYQRWKKQNNAPHFFYYSRGEGQRDFETRTNHLLSKRVGRFWFD